VPTVGRVPNGAIIERQIEFSLATLGHLRLSLRTPTSPRPRIAITVND
jgi:flagellar P-ring protein FlgI